MTGKPQQPQYDDTLWEIPSFDKIVYEKKCHKYALVIPVINEGERIRNQLKRIQEKKIPIDVIVADGGSTDDSLHTNFVKSVGVRAVLTKTGVGKLSAQLRMAYAWCIREGYKGIVTIDGNNKDGLDAIAQMIEKLDAGYDYVQGSRYLPGGHAENTPLERTIANRFIHAPLLSLAGRQRFTDTTNGFRAYSSAYLTDPKVLPFRDIFQNYELLFYLTTRAGQIGRKVGHVPVHRSYPANEKVPTKIKGMKGKIDILKQTLGSFSGSYNPRGSSGPVIPFLLLALFVFMIAWPSYAYNIWLAANPDFFAQLPKIPDDRLVYDALAADSNRLGYLNEKGFEIYVSQYGAHIPFFNAFGGLEGPFSNNLRAINISLMAVSVALLTFFIGWRTVLSMRGTFVFGVFLALSPMVIMVSGSLYWMSWVWYLPLFVSFIFGPHLWKPKFLVLAAFCWLVTLLFSNLFGYEYASTIAIIAAAPIVFFGFKAGHGLFRTTVPVAILGLTSVLALGIAIVMHITTIPVSKDGLTGWQQVQLVAEKRVSSKSSEDDLKTLCELTPYDVVGKARDLEVETCIVSLARTQSASLPVVLMAYSTFRRTFPYLGGTDLIDNPKLESTRRALREFNIIKAWKSLSGNFIRNLGSTLSLPFSMLIVWSTMLLVAFKAWRAQNVVQPVIYMLIVAAAGPVSWFVLATAHSYAHLQFNFVLWCLFFLPLLFGVATEKWETNN